MSLMIQGSPEGDWYEQGHREHARLGHPRRRDGFRRLEPRRGPGRQRPDRPRGLDAAGVVPWPAAGASGSADPAPAAPAARALRQGEGVAHPPGILREQAMTRLSSVNTGNWAQETYETASRD